MFSTNNLLVRSCCIFLLWSGRIQKKYSFPEIIAVSQDDSSTGGTSESRCQVPCLRGRSSNPSLCCLLLQCGTPAWYPQIHASDIWHLVHPPFLWARVHLAASLVVIPARTLQTLHHLATRNQWISIVMSDDVALPLEVELVRYFLRVLLNSIADNQPSLVKGMNRERVPDATEASSYIAVAISSSSSLNHARSPFKRHWQLDKRICSCILVNQLRPFQWESVERSFLIFFSLCFFWYAFSIRLAAFSSSILQNSLKVNISFNLFVWVSVHPFQCFCQRPFNIVLSTLELTSECSFPF